MERNHVIIRFLPVLFNQLFKVLTQNDSDEVTSATTRYGEAMAVHLNDYRKLCFCRWCHHVFPFL